MYIYLHVYIHIYILVAWVCANTGWPRNTAEGHMTFASRKANLLSAGAGAVLSRLTPRACGRTAPRIAYKDVDVRCK